MRTCLLLFLWLGLMAPCFLPAQSSFSLLDSARQFPPMPRGTIDLIPFVQGLPTFASGAPFNDLEFTLLDTDYIDGENSGGDVFMPVDPSDSLPGADQVKYIRCILNTDLNQVYGSADEDRIILGTHEIELPFFMRGSDGIDNDYVVIQHLDFETGYLQLKGSPADYELVYGTVADGCQTEGWYLFYTANAQADLIAFIFPCWDISPSVSGNPPNNPNPICNADSSLSLTNPHQFRYAEPIERAPVLPAGIAQFGSEGKEIVSGITVDTEGYVYLYGCTDGNLDGGADAPNELFVAKLHPNGNPVWVTELPLSEGSILKDATTDSTYLYACGRTLGALPGFSNAGRWDGIILKLSLSDGQIVATDQWGNAGIDGYGNIALDDAGNFFVSAQGSPPGAGGTDDVYLVAKHRCSDLGNVWRELNATVGTGFAASAEAWGGLTYEPGPAPGQGRLVVAGWYFSNLGADAFVSVYENLAAAQPTRPHSLVLAAPGPRADWVLDNAVDAQGNIYVGGFTTGNIGATPQGEGDAFLIKYGPTLSNPVIRQFGTPKSDLIRKMAFDQDGNLYVVGYTYGDLDGNNQDPSGLTGDIFVRKYDSNLNVLAARQFGTPHEDRSFLHVQDRLLYLGGMTEGSLVGASLGTFDGFALALDQALEWVAPMLTDLDDSRGTMPLRAYPNPTTGLLTVDWPTGARVRQVHLLDAWGQTIRTQVVWAGLGMQWDLSGLAPGLYLLKVDLAEVGASAHVLPVLKQ